MRLTSLAANRKDKDEVSSHRHTVAIQTVTAMVAQRFLGVVEHEEMYQNMPSSNKNDQIVRFQSNPIIFRGNFQRILYLTVILVSEMPSSSAASYRSPDI